LSLREAIHLANQNPLFDTITFDPMVVQFVPVFPLSGAGLAADQSADMRIRTSMDIVGPGAASLTLDGAGLTHGLFPTQGVQRIFTVDNGVAGTIDVKISGLELRNTVSNGQGGAILSRENLTLDDMQFTGNGTEIFDPLLTGVVTGGLHGGAIFQDGASLTINNSTLSGNSTFSPDSDGGAIFAQNAAVTLDYVNIAGNSTIAGNSRGGGVALRNSTLTASEATISGNSTTAGLSDGGGVFLDGSTALFEESAIAGNFTRGSNARGGGVATRGASQVSFEKSTVLSFNRTDANGSVGGALFVGGGTADFNNSTLIENFTNGQNAGGGAAAVGTGGTLRLNGATVTLNRTVGSGSHGGALANLSGNLTVRNSTVSGNQAQHSAGRGGGVFSDSNLVGSQLTTILNSTISGNSAGSRGGGLFNGDGRTEIKHSTITNNSTPFIGAGNGVGSQGNSATLTVVESSIIAGNVGSAGGTGSDVDFVDAPFVNSFQSLGSNVVGTTSTNALASFNQPRDKTGITNPLLGPLASNGGPTQTHALLAGSPAINNGSPSFNPNAFTPPLTTDQRGTGFPRVLGGRIDAGAFESALSAFSADFDGDGDVDGRDFLTWQRGVGINSGATKAQGDANGDGRVNGADLTQWRQQFGGVSSEVAQAPASVGGGAETAQAVRTPSISPLVAAAMEPVALEPTVLAESASTGDVAFVAGAGAPAAAARSSYRPPVARRAAAYDAVDAAYAHVIAPASMAGTDGGSFGLASDGDDAESADDLSSEDAVFALLGEGLL
jgi:hypothetical protein